MRHSFFLGDRVKETAAVLASYWIKVVPTFYPSSLILILILILIFSPSFLLSFLSTFLYFLLISY